jgi:diaminopimelate decarboxylase
MHYFVYRGSELFVEDVSVKELAAEVGVPAYVYSARTLRRHYKVFDQALAGTDHLICFAVKALSNLSVLKLLAAMGSGFDIVSQGELARCLRAGADPRKIVFSGVGKTAEEIAAALNAGILMFNIESRPELHQIAAIARRLDKRAPVSLRVNPDLDPGTHPHISTGHRTSKFGVPLTQLDEYYREAKAFKELEVVGLSTHIGSQITESDPFREAGEKLAGAVRALWAKGIELKYLDLGGGVGVPYRDESVELADYSSAILKPLRPLNLRLIAEPGRVIAGNAGILLTRVLYIKETDVKRFIVIDGAMNDLIRPALYDAYHAIWPVEKREAADLVVADVVGPVCESGDFFARDRLLPLPRAGDLLAVMGAGAYGFVMASNYNSRPRPPEVLVDGRRWHIVRGRETFDDLVRGERLVEVSPEPEQ